MTPRECARLQGFLDDFKIVVSDNQDYKQFGNSVLVNVSIESKKLNSNFKFYFFLKELNGSLGLSDKQTLQCIV